MGRIENLTGMVLCGGFTGLEGYLSLRNILEYANASTMLLKEKLNPELTSAIYQNIEKIANNSFWIGMLNCVATGILAGLTIYCATPQDREN